MRSPPLGLAKFDSASAMIRALACFLHGRSFPRVGQPLWMEYPAKFVNRLPRKTREWVFAKLGAEEGVAPQRIANVSARHIAQWMTELYPRRQYPAVILGSSSGALMHLAAAFGLPWLPQTFLTLVKQNGVDPDDAAGAMKAGQTARRLFLAANPDVQLHHMHDPNQDRLMLRYITYFRSKFIRLPPAYRAFLSDALAPGGTIIVAEGQRHWPTTRLGDREIFQFGAEGGATVEEYLHGGPRVAACLARYGSQRSRWEPPHPNAETPEAEWGFEPALHEEIEAFAKAKGFRIVRLLFKEPEDLSPIVADLYRHWHRKRGLPADRLLIESFILLEPYWTFRLGAVPFWMKFNMEPSLHWVLRYLSTAEPFDHIHMMLFAHGADAVGLPPIEAWRDVLRMARVQGIFIGVEPAAYPAHFATYARYHRELEAISARHPLPEPLPLEALGSWITPGAEGSSVRLLS